MRGEQGPVARSRRWASRRSTLRSVREAPGRARPARLPWNPLRSLPGGPVGWILAASLVLSTGNGAWFTGWAIFFIRSVGLSASQFGIGITAAGLVGLVAGSPIGYLADRVGTREVLVCIGVLQGLAVLSYALVHQFWPFVLVSCVLVTAERAAPAIRIAVISGVASEEERLQNISTVRVVQHVGIVAGSLVGGVILYLDSRAAYLAMLLVYGGACITSAAMITRVPHVESLSDRKVRRRMLVLRDRPFLLITALSGLLALNWGMLGTGVPLWITAHTHAPRWIIGAITAVNAVAIILFQNRASRAGRTVPGAARLAVFCGAALALSCLLFAATYHGSGALVVVLLLAATAVHVVGELLYFASGWGLSVGLAPPSAQGEYQGMFGTGPAAALTIAPVLMATLLVDWGLLGWLALAVLFLVAGTPVGAAGRWAQRTRDQVALASGSPAQAPLA